ncbi:hypothetical protein RND71_012258 [Anisodus tanguticus]|uniref:Glabrous enhancer-binding protein-like DBD domain-containing protein n=1 Tax=Anisodus tanguticus TaxID=243964 RepID=A0AAE1SGN4_9SOLA|nr:hypothetical protein RND71_012258 [Anisodus tanguticus]
MAPKNKFRLVDQPPSASSSEEQVEESQEEEEEEEDQEEQSDDEESGEEEDQEPKTSPPKPTTQKQVQTPQKPQSSSSSETQNGSESESESGQSQPSPSASDFTFKPTVPSKSTTKRPQETQQKDSKRKKPKIAEEEEKKTTTTTPIIRLWSDEDQVAILKGMLEFKNQKGTEPNTDMSAFHEFIKGKLQVEVSKTQLSEKLRRLKKKFLTNVKDGEEPIFSKPHDHLVFEYSKKIWGSPSNGVKVNVKDNNTNGKAKKAVDVKKSVEPKKSGKVSTFNKPKGDEKEKHKEEEKEKQIAVKEVVEEDNIVKGGDQLDFQSKYPRLAKSFESMADLSSRYPNAASLLKENMSLIANDKAKVLEEKWKKLEEEEADLIVKRLNMISEHYKLVADAMKDSCPILEGLCPLLFCLRYPLVCDHSAAFFSAGCSNSKPSFYLLSSGLSLQNYLARFFVGGNEVALLNDRTYHTQAALMNSSVES